MLERQGLPDSARLTYLEAADTYQEAEAWDLHRATLQKTAELAFRKRRNWEAIDAYRRLLEQPKLTLSDSLRGDYHFYTGLSYARASVFDQALDHMKKATQSREAALPPHSEVLAQTYHTLGRIYFVIGDFHQSLAYQRKFLRINQTNYPDDHPLVSEGYHYVALSYSRLYEHDLALEYYLKSAALLKNQDSYDPNSLASIYNNIGLVYGRKGEEAKCLEYLQLALSIRDDLHGGMSSTVQNIGRSYLELENYEEAAAYLYRAARMKLSDYGPGHTTVGDAYSEISILHYATQRYDSALHYAQKALDIYHLSFGQVGHLIADTYRQKSSILLAQQKYEEALSAIQLATAALVQDYNTTRIAQQPGRHDIILDHRSLTNVLYDKSRLLYDYYQHSGEAQHLRHSQATIMATVDLVDTLFKNLDNKESFQFLADKAVQIYEHGLQTTLELHALQADPQLLAQAFAMMERNKAGLLLQNLAESRWKKQLNLPDSLNSRESELKARLAYFEKLRFEEVNSTAPDSVRIAGYRDRIFGIRRELDGLRTLIREQNPQYRSLFEKRPYISLQDVQQNLIADNELLIEYFQGDSSLYAMAIDREESRLFRLGHTGELLPALSNLIEGLREKDYPSYAPAAHQLYQQLLAPLLDAGETQKRLLIIPDGQLGYLPFEALLAEAPPQKARYDQLAYLILEHTINYQYSASLLSHTKDYRAEPHEYEFLGFAPSFNKKANPLLVTRSAQDRALVSQLSDLPFAREEVRQIASLYSGLFVLEEEATESRFKETAGQGRIIHLASHTLVNDEAPLYSRLVFAPDQGTEEDGLLHTYELYNMRLNAEMVTLSACNTGIGKIRKGEGIISLARGFMQAGVPNVLMSLWSVSDRSTSQLMQAFYEAFHDGHDKAEALRKAKLSYLEQADANTAAPYYWSGFVLIGNQSMTQQNDVSLAVFITLTAATLLLSFWFVSKKYSQK
jgi:CHAT domain-containing protein/tetratricopeptide (TPR) repeat protein